jgi:hypothetical protein
MRSGILVVAPFGVHNLTQQDQPHQGKAVRTTLKSSRRIPPLEKKNCFMLITNNSFAGAD